MQLWHIAVRLGLLASITLQSAAESTWGYTDATVSVQTKGAGVGSGVKESILDSKPLAKPLSLGSADNLKITLTSQEGRTAKRAHQTFLLLTDPVTELDVAYPFTVKDNGKARLELAQKDLPIQFLSIEDPIDARLLIGSFGSSRAHDEVVFKISIMRNPDVPVPTAEALRQGKLPEIHHVFRPDPKSPPIVVTLAFVGMVLAALVVLAGIWIFLGVNVNHLPTAFKSAPIPHAAFLGSLAAIEGLFFLYYTSWNLFQLLPAVAVAGAIALVSGSRALSEAQGRRISNLR